ncbi:hypothetical protein AB0B45_27425 [Nonomuraea sp. NPDC049152]|uniref:hypothetical protein n=1 Tax=Nonomuraea sp. NPDC049152 TaxID=3154350 RepID=UPI0033C230F9
MRTVYGRLDDVRAKDGPPGRPKGLGGYNIYDGGALVLYALQKEIGERDFDRVMRRWVQRNEDGNASTEDFIAHAVKKQRLRRPPLRRLLRECARRSSPRAHSACNDANPCSLETARDKVRAAIAGGMDRDIEVRLTGGVYRMAEPLVLDGRDSGPRGHTVTWTAAPGAEPVLSGGVPITGWRQEGGFWVAKVPEGVIPRQLFVDGVRAVRARGDACPASVCDATRTGMTGAVRSGVAAWREPANAEAVIRIRWRNYHRRIDRVDGDLLTFVQPCWTNSAGGTNRTGPAWDSTTVDSSRYTKVSHFENAIELLDRPGEFVYDRGGRTVTYLPRQGEDLSEVITPARETLLRIEGASRVRISGLGFEHAAYPQQDTDEGYAGMQAGLTLTGATGPVDHAGR